LDKQTGRHVDIQVSRQARKPKGNREAKRHSDMPYSAGRNETTDKRAGKQTTSRQGDVKKRRQAGRNTGRQTNRQRSR
jgi:hypothetical protein